MFAYSKKQAGVVYGAWKRGNITAEKSTIDAIYKLAGTTFSTGSIVTAALDGNVCKAVQAIFRNNYKEAQKAIDRFAELLHTETPVAA